MTDATENSKWENKLYAVEPPLNITSQDENKVKAARMQWRKNLAEAIERSAGIFKRFLDKPKQSRDGSLMLDENGQPIHFKRNVYYIKNDPGVMEKFDPFLKQLVFIKNYADVFKPVKKMTSKLTTEETAKIGTQYTPEIGAANKAEHDRRRQEYQERQGGVMNKDLNNQLGAALDPYAQGQAQVQGPVAQTYSGYHR